MVTCARRGPGSAALILLVILVWAPARAQISPGKLVRQHAELEGVTQCLKCHAPGRGVAAEKCLVCHSALAERISQKKGLHARAGYEKCEKCHIEHHGAEPELVYWGKGGRDAFDHRETGFALLGKHAKLPCRECHQPRLNPMKDMLARARVDLDRTFLGLATTCLSCHLDEHRGQFKGRECTTCHTEDAWKPASRFDHSKTSAPLTGKHAAVPCDKCHVKEPSAQSRWGWGPNDMHKEPSKGDSFVRYRGLASLTDCVSCHADVHRGAFGKNCTSCHATSGWERVDIQGKGVRFDHDRTGFPLRGRHAPVSCDKCHSGKFAKLKHDLCIDCHADAHLGQLASRTDKGKCEACHTVEGFLPARFSAEDHEKTRYPLQGSHLAVACDLCHPKVPRETLGRIPGLTLKNDPRIPARTTQLRFASTRCQECHRDPHRGEVDRYVRAGGCESCHSVESWQTSGFDHSKTRFPLTGGHARALCARCHRAALSPDGSGDSPELSATGVGPRREKEMMPHAMSRKEGRLVLSGLGTTCQACHADPHRGQLPRPGPSPCEACHVVDNWTPTRFDHNRDSAYPLDGAHVKVPCASCHPRETSGGVAFTRFKPLGTACKDCHGARIPKVKGDM